MEHDGDFNNDLAEGQKTEDLFLKQFVNILVKHKGYKKDTIKYKKYNDDSGDVKVFLLSERNENNKPKEIFFEVKDNLTGARTGNIFIELKSRKKLSGLIHTKADYWVNKINYNGNNVFYVIETDRLRQAILDKRYYVNSTHPDGVFSGGDHNSSLGYLLHYSVVEEIVLEGRLKKDGSFTLKIE